MHPVAFRFEADRYHASVAGDDFLVGRRVRYGAFKGLMNDEPVPRLRYRAEDWRERHGIWADWIEPIARVEGGHFHTLNTYDRARCTFGFLQAGAHVAGGQFVRWLRAVLALPDAAASFPDLGLDQGRIVHLADGDGAPRPLEDDRGTAGLLDYLNPGPHEVEDVEVIQAARLIHRVRNDAEARALQVAIGVTALQESLGQYAARYGLDGADDITCLLVADIRHQGRAPHVAIGRALATTDPHAALLALGAERYPERIARLRAAVEELRREGRLGRWRFDAAGGLFA
jgi:hypothetical protein